MEGVENNNYERGITMKCCKKPDCTSKYCERHETCTDKCASAPVLWDVGHQEVTVTLPFTVFEGSLEESRNHGKMTFEQLHEAIESMRVAKYEEA